MEAAAEFGSRLGSGGGVCLGEDFYWVEDGAITYVLDLHFAGAALCEDVGRCG